MTGLRRFQTDEKGQAAIELAFTAPIFFALFFGALQCGLMLWTQLGLQHAAERAARCAAINPTLCGSLSLVQTYAASQALSVNLNASAFTLTSETCGIAVTGATIVKFVTYNVSLSAKSCFPK